MLEEKKESPLGKQVLIRDKVRDYLNNAIVTGELEPETRIVETKLAKELGVSQAPVREALCDLESRGLVVSIPYQGTYVRKITPKDMRDVYTVRIGLEKLALEEIKPNSITDSRINQLRIILDNMIKAGSMNDFDNYIKYDYDFHFNIIKCSDNQFLIRLWEQSHMLDWIRSGTKLLGKSNLEELASRHSKIYEALASKNLEVTYNAMKEHLDELLVVIYEKNTESKENS